MSGANAQLRLLITAGPTREPIDPVRYLSNASTGRQGIAIACAARDAGWRVDLVHGPLEVPVPDGIEAHPVSTAAEMLHACLPLHSQCDILVGAAAVSDYRPRQPMERKRKRNPREDGWSLELVPTVDILAELAPKKGARIHAGFALETENGLAGGRIKLESKNLDWLVVNGPEAIGAEGSCYLLVGREGAVVDLGPLSKVELAVKLVATLGAERRQD